MAGKHIGLWEVRRKKFFFLVIFLMGIKQELYELQSSVYREIYYSLGSKSEHQL